MNVGMSGAGMSGVGPAAPAGSPPAGSPPAAGSAARVAAVGGSSTGRQHWLQNAAPSGSWFPQWGQSNIATFLAAFGDVRHYRSAQERISEG
jgi:hypothetical protein